MPITLGCPSCGKRFRARDESLGKKVKCPYCQAAVQVTAEDQAPVMPPSGQTAGLPVAPPREPALGGSTPGLPATEPPAVASPADWGAATPAPAPGRSAPPAPVADPFPPRKPERDKEKPKEKDRPRPAKSRADKPQKPPEQVLAAGWYTVRRGLFWVQFALLFVALIGCVGFGKIMYTRFVGPLPKGDGAEWVTIEGFINSRGENSIPVSKEEMINLAAYGVPFILASILLVFGRLIASGGPRMSGSRGLFGLSSLFTLLAFVALFGSFLFAGAFKDESDQLRFVYFLLAPMAELWFLIAITACGLALKRPGVARSVGAIIFLTGLAAAALTVGWYHYATQWRPIKPDPNSDIVMYEQAVFMLGWLLMVAVYWRAVRGVRVGAREYIDTVETRD